MALSSINQTIVNFSEQETWKENSQVPNASSARITTCVSQYHRYHLTFAIAQACAYHVTLFFALRRVLLVRALAHLRSLRCQPGYRWLWQSRDTTFHQQTMLSVTMFCILPRPCLVIFIFVIKLGDSSADFCVFARESHAVVSDYMCVRLWRL